MHGACMGWQRRRSGGSEGAADWSFSGAGPIYGMFRAEAEAEAKVVEEVEAEAEARLAARPAAHETGAAVVAVASMGARVIVAATAALLRVHLVTARAPRNHGLRAGRQ